MNSQIKEIHNVLGENFPKGQRDSKGGEIWKKITGATWTEEVGTV